MDKSTLTHQTVINPTYPYRLVDLIDETAFGADAHKVRLLNERLDPIAWDLLKSLLLSYIANSTAYNDGYRKGYEDGKYEACDD
jgi:hypothetical protein